ncbi:GGDEF domain-containing response regulator [Desulforapulum autotrophicum]|uniref:GGDEF domain-containing response regulator n=1 Tax=Desulforapulum autotrophicum TaxID=2296 RepID=UPI001E47F8CE|nr:diguanylate cyclase [Desulforapulum autotrophicum]
MDRKRETDLALVVDDDPFMRMVIVAALKKIGLDVIDTDNGSDGITLFNSERPDIIMMDVVMPGMDGFEACERIRKSPGGDLVQILMVTGLEDVESAKKAFKIGADGFITKPFNLPILSQQVQYTLRAGRAFRELNISRSRLAKTQELAMIGNWQFDFKTNQFSCSPEACHLMCLEGEAADMTLDGFFNSINDQDRKRVKEAVECSIQSIKPLSQHCLIHCPDESHKYILNKSEPLFDEHNNPALMLGVVQDITQLKEAEYRLITLSQAVEQSGSTILITDLNGVIEFVNPAFTHVTGYTPEEAVGKSTSILKSGMHPPEFYKNLWDTIISGDTWKGQIINRKKDGELYWESATISPVMGKDGNITHYSAVKEDITSRKKAEKLLKETQKRLETANQKLQTLVTSDGLTMIANRRKFDEYLDQEWQRCKRAKVWLSLLMCDIDYFKHYNDTYGHQAGDDCLRKIAQAMEKTVVRPMDLVARYGGEEFAVILSDTGLNGACHVARRIQEDVKNLNIAHSESSVSTHVTLSIGITCLIPDDEDLSMDLLIKTADEALYKAKRKGRNRMELKVLTGNH